VRSDNVTEIISRVDASGAPRIEIIRPAAATGTRLAVFASSFNPPTLAHTELIRRAVADYGLDEVLALAGIANADKSDYECPLHERLAMTFEAFGTDPRLAVGLCSHAFYVDMVEALDKLYPPETDLHFIIGFDTFERVLDLEDRYTARYYQRFGDRQSAFEFLLRRSRLIVAGRGAAGREAVERLLDSEPAAVRERVLFLDFPVELASRSASEVREQIRLGQSVSGLVSRPVERYIEQRGLYR